MVTFADAKEVSNTVISDIDPVSVVLFGSVAKEGVGADLDLLIVTDDGYNQQDLAMRVHRVLKKHYKKFSIEPFVVPLSLFAEYYEKGSPFLRAILKQGRLIYMKDAVKDWIKQAEDERNMAGYLLKGGFFRGACYHSQQAVEKAIKTLLLNKGWDLEKTHSLDRLVTIAETFNVTIGLPEEDVVFLDTIYRGRYPIEAGLLPIGEPTESQARRAVEICDRVTGQAIKNLTGI